MKKEIAKSLINPIFLKGICHRGLHNENFSENGINAFKNAIEHNMAFELDIHLTSDGQLVVFHDSDLKRMTQKDGIIENLTLNEIKQNYKLLDGEEIPTFQEVLNITQEKVPIVVELKVYNKNYKALANRVEQELKQIKDKRNIMLISFDPRSLFPFKNKGFIRQLLVAKSDEYTWFFRHFFEGVDLEFSMFDEKRVRRYAKKHFTNVWTIDTKQKFDDIFSPQNFIDTVTFQFIDSDYVKEKLKVVKKKIFKTE